MTVSGAGSCEVTASQAGTADIDAAAPVVRTVTINKTPQTITFAQPAAVTFGSAPVALVSVVDEWVDGGVRCVGAVFGDRHRGGADVDGVGCGVV